jgi:hypothetical protein
MATPYPITDSLLHRGIEHVCYEYANLMSAAYWTIHGAAPWRTNVDDAFLLGYRKLADFLMKKKRMERLGAELPDILASDYYPPFPPVWKLPTWEKEWQAEMDKQLAHISFVRDKEWIHYKWVPILESEFRTAWAMFLDAVDPKFKPEFDAQIAHCQAKPGFAGIKL